MAGSPTFQVSTPGYQDISAPSRAGFNSLINTLDGIQTERNRQTNLLSDSVQADRKFEEDKRATAEAERLAREALKSLDASRKKVGAAERRKEAKAAKEAASIKDMLGNFNTKNGINTGLETQTAVNSTYDELTNQYNNVIQPLKQKEAENNVFLDMLTQDKLKANSKGDAITYSSDGTPQKSAEIAKIDSLETMLQQENEKIKLTDDAILAEMQTKVFGTPLEESLKATVNQSSPFPVSNDPIEGVVRDAFISDTQTELDDTLAKKSQVTSAFEGKRDDLNVGMQEATANNPKFLDAVTNPNRIANEMYDRLIAKGVDHKVAADTAKTWLANNKQEVDKDLLTSLKDSLKVLKDDAPEKTVKITKGITEKTGKGGGVKFKNNEPVNKQVEDYWKLNANSGWFSINDGMSTATSFDEKLKEEFPLSSEKDRFYALINAGETAFLNGATVLDYKLASDYLNSGGYKTRANMDGGEKTETTVKFKDYTPQQLQLKNALVKKLDAAQNPNLTVGRNVGKKFLKEATNPIDLKQSLIVKKKPKAKPTVKTKPTVEAKKSVTKKKSVAEALPAKKSENNPKYKSKYYGKTEKEAEKLGIKPAPAEYYKKPNGTYGPTPESERYYKNHISAAKTKAKKPITRPVKPDIVKKYDDKNFISKKLSSITGSKIQKKQLAESTKYYSQLDNYVQDWYDKNPKRVPGSTPKEIKDAEKELEGFYHTRRNRSIKRNVNDALGVAEAFGPLSGTAKVIKPTVSGAKTMARKVWEMTPKAKSNRIAKRLAANTAKNANKNKEISKGLKEVLVTPTNSRYLKKDALSAVKQQLAKIVTKTGKPKKGQKKLFDKLQKALKDHEAYIAGK